MNDKLFQKLKNEFPLIYSKLSNIDCLDGWFHLIKSVSHTVESNIEYLPEELKQGIYLVQIKQKFGGLRLYFNHTTPYIDGAVACAEAISYYTCEHCGNPGKSRNYKGFIYVGCEDHKEVKYV